MTSSTSDERVLVSKFRSVHLKWTSEEDNRLQEAVQKYGAKNWKLVAEVVGTRDASEWKNSTTNQSITISILLTLFI